MTPAPLTITWHGKEIRIRHDDPELAPYSPKAQTIGAAMSLAATEDGLRRVLEATVGDRYLVDVRDGPVVALRRR